MSACVSGSESATVRMGAQARARKGGREGARVRAGARTRPHARLKTVAGPRNAGLYRRTFRPFGACSVRLHGRMPTTPRFTCAGSSSPSHLPPLGQPLIHPRAWAGTPNQGLPKQPDGRLAPRLPTWLGTWSTKRKRVQSLRRQSPQSESVPSSIPRRPGATGLDLPRF